MKKKRYQIITNYYKPDGVPFKSCHGLVTWSEWMGKEIAIAKKIGRKLITINEVKKRKETGRLALARVC